MGTDKRLLSLGLVLTAMFVLITNPITGITAKIPASRVMIAYDLGNAYGQGVKECVRSPLHKHEFDAFVSVATNVGLQEFCSSRVASYANAYQYRDACSAILGATARDLRLYMREPYKPTWNVQDREGNINKALQDRRLTEYKLCIGETQ
jgi:GH24 family phage-related lysozyme (muramidase)